MLRVLDGDCVRRCRCARAALADGAFAPGHVTPMIQVSGTNELMTQIHDA